MTIDLTPWTILIFTSSYVARLPMAGISAYTATRLITKPGIGSSPDPNTQPPYEC